MTQTGSYLVQVSSAEGCVSTDEIFVTVDPCLGSGEFDNTVSIYPNPATEKVSIELYNDAEFSAFLMDETRRIIEYGVAKGNQVDFNLSRLANGIYSITVLTGENTITKKIVKQ